MKTKVRLFVAVTFACFFLTVVSRASAQEVVASYADSVGSIVRYRVSDGSEVSRVQQVYRVGATVYRVNTIAVEDSTSYYVVFGNRYLARLRASDGAFVWVVDAGATNGFTTYPVADIAVAGGHVFLCNADPGGRVAKYRAADGALVWQVARAVQAGVLIHTPLKLAAAGNESLFALVGSQFLTRMSQSNGAVVFQVNIPLTSFLVTWGVRDLTVGGGLAHVTNFDPAGSLRRFSVNNGAYAGVAFPSYSVNSTKYLPTKLAASGSNVVMTMLGERYLARLNAIDGGVVWTRDIGLVSGNTTHFPTDIAAIATP